MTKNVDASADKSDGIEKQTLEHFTRSEFKCKCCGECKMDPVFLQQLDHARDIAGIPFVIHSGYRCPSHNTAEGSTSDNHPLGVAADILCDSGPLRLKIVRALLTAGFQRLGIGKTFIHADLNDGPTSIWLY